MDFRNITLSLSSSLDFNQWKDIYKKIVYWELEIEKINDDSIRPFLIELKSIIDRSFVDYIEKSYIELLETDFFQNNFADFKIPQN